MFNCHLEFNRLQDESPTRSLGLVAEDCFGPAEMEGVKLEVIRALTNFYRLQYLVSHMTAHVDRIFSWEQRYSYQLLFDWWTAAFQDPAVPLRYFYMVLAQSPIIVRELETTLIQTRPELFACISIHMNALQPGHSRMTTELDESEYNNIMWALFIQEFIFSRAYNRQEENPSMSLRRSAAREAYRQQVAFESFRGQRINPHLHDMLAESLSTSFICSHQASDTCYSRTVQRGPLMRACSWLDPNASISGQRLSEKDDQDDQLAGWPEYLWDLDKGHAVRTKDLDNKRPEYTAISHTWGRWRDPRSGHLLPAETTPKDLMYHIPLSRLRDFNVENISQDLRKLKEKVNTDYVWLDLVCLPQGIEGTRLSDRSEQLKEREIARQAWIFRNAKFAIAWLHDVQDLSCLEGIFKLYALFLPHLKLASEDEKAKEKLVSEALGKIVGLTGLLHPLDSPIDPIGLGESVAEDSQRHGTTATSGSDQQIRQASLWFTSLWTLQEVCLRPDMWLATANWSIWSWDNNQPIPLNGFLCVKGGTRMPDYVDNAEEYRDFNFAKQETVDWELTTGLNQLLELSRADIIRLGDRRYCERSRAEAIMSALGATTWFSLRGDREKDLILGKYPQSFVEEVRNLIPGDFFTAYAKLPHADAHDFNRVAAGVLERNDGYNLAVFYSYEFGLDGSLLPFSLMGHRYMRFDRICMQLDVHGSIMSWKLATSGHVGITKACILSSSTIKDIPKSPKVLTGTFLGFIPSSVEDENETTGVRVSPSAEDKVGAMVQERDLHEWTRTRKCEIHLVLVMEKVFKEFHEWNHQVEAPTETDEAEELHALKGIVLRAAFERHGKESEPDSANGKHKLVKIGCFDAVFHGRVNLPEVREVDWEVL